MNDNGNFKMKCIDTKGDAGYRLGKIYKVIDGYWKNDRGILMGHSNIKTINDVNEWSLSKWELAEEVNTVEERMEIIAEMLGVELEEEFNILNDNSTLYYGPYKITKQGLIDKDSIIRDERLGNLLRGAYKIEKLPWKPKHGEAIWKVCDGSIHVNAFSSSNSSDVALYKCGWMFRTKEEAEANKERIIKEMKEVLGNE